MNNKKISIGCTLAIGMVAALVLAGTAMGEVSRTGLVAEYHFDGDAKDSSGNGNDGTIYGSDKFVQGISGQALSFDGSNNYVNIGDPVSGVLDFGATNSFTLAAFFNSNTFSGKTRSIMQKWTTPPNKGYYLRFQIEDGNLRFHILDESDGGTNPMVTYATSNFATGTWYHVAAVRDVAANKLRLYVNGIEVASVTSTSKATSNSGDLYIGSAPSPYNGIDNFNGLIDEIQIYTRALSADEIKTLYQSYLSPPSPKLTLTKSLSPSTITEGDSTTVTIRVENTGGDAKSVKITDTIPQGFTLVSGSASQEYATLKATESRTFQYTVKATGTGRFVSDLATVTYQDEKGNSYSGASNSATITVQAGQVGQVPAAQPKTPGFETILAGIGIILALALRRR